MGFGIPELVCVVALVAVGCYLWVLLAHAPLRLRLLAMACPASQLVVALTVLSLADRSVQTAFTSEAFAAIIVMCAALDVPFFHSIRRSSEARIEEERVRFAAEQLAAQERHLAEMQRAEQETRAVQGRFDAQLARLETALTEGDDAAAQVCLEGAADVVRAPMERFCENPAVDALLGPKKARCGELGIDARFSAAVPFDVDMSPVELCAIFGNALDNAMAACEALPAGGRWVELDAHPEHGYLSLAVRNPYGEGAEDISRLRQERSSLVPEHGWGLSIIRSMVEGRDGELTCGSEDGVFTLNAIWRA